MKLSVIKWHGGYRYGFAYTYSITPDLGNWSICELTLDEFKAYTRDYPQEKLVSLVQSMNQIPQEFQEAFPEVCSMVAL